jgi:hypothetical protein
MRPVADCGRVGGWRGNGLCRGSWDRMPSSDGEPGASLFHPPPSEPDLQRFRVSGSPADLFDNDEQRRFSVTHVAYLHELSSGPPVPLRHVSGFPGLGLLWGLRRPRARAP